MYRSSERDVARMAYGKPGASQTWSRGLVEGMPISNLKRQNDTELEFSLRSKKHKLLK